MIKVVDTLIWLSQNNLAQALGYEAIKQGKEVLYRSIFDLVRDFMKDEAFNNRTGRCDDISSLTLVIIEDMGLKALPAWGGVVGQTVAGVAPVAGCQRAVKTGQGGADENRPL